MPYKVKTDGSIYKLRDTVTKEMKTIGDYWTEFEDIPGESKERSLDLEVVEFERAKVIPEPRKVAVMAKPKRVARRIV